MSDVDWRTKPFPILISTLFWAAGAIFAPVYIAWRNSAREKELYTTSSFVFLFSLTLCLSFAVLAFLRGYWLRHRWARPVAMIMAALGALRDLRGGYWLWINSPRFSGIFLALFLAELAFNSYLLGWLQAKEGREYFNPVHTMA